MNIQANPLDYDAKYPQIADAHTNGEAKIINMEKNIGREVMFQIDGQQFYGKISSVPNSEHYCVVVKDTWDWYIREEAIHFIQNTNVSI